MDLCWYCINLTSLYIKVFSFLILLKSWLNLLQGIHIIFLVVRVEGLDIVEWCCDFVSDFNLCYWMLLIFVSIASVGSSNENATRNPSNPAFVEVFEVEDQWNWSQNQYHWILLVEPIPVVYGMPWKPSQFERCTHLKMKPPHLVGKNPSVMMWQQGINHRKILC